MNSRLHKAHGLVMSLALSLVLALSSGCREERSPVEAWDARAAELRAELELERAEVDRVCEGYELSTFGDVCRVKDCWRLVLRAYRRISDEFVKVRGREGVVLRNRWAHWLASRLEEEKRLHELKQSRDGKGSYGNIFLSCSQIDLYERVIKLLLLDSEGLARWMRIEGAQGTIADVPIAFTNGEARVVLPWRIFGQRPYMDDVAYAPSVEPDHVVTLNGKDYAVVRFPNEDSPEGCPTTTEEAMLFEIVDGKIVRVVGLHNFLMGDIRADADAGLLHLKGEDGYGKSVSLVIDVNSMKIVRARSVLPAYFEQDGYWQFLDVGIDTIGSPYEAELGNAERLYECGDLALFVGETESDIAFNEKEAKREKRLFCAPRNSLFLRRRTKGGTNVWRLVMTSGGDWDEARAMGRLCKERALDVKKSFNVMKASLSRDGRFIWLVCDLDFGTYDVVCRFDWAKNSFAVLTDGDTAEEQADGTILIRNKKTYLSDENGEPLGAARYDVWITPDGKVVRETTPTRKVIGE